MVGAVLKVAVADRLVQELVRYVSVSMLPGGMVGFGNPNFENAPPRKDDDSAGASGCL